MHGVRVAYIGCMLYVLLQCVGSRGCTLSIFSDVLVVTYCRRTECAACCKFVDLIMCCVRPLHEDCKIATILFNFAQTLLVTNHWQYRAVHAVGTGLETPVAFHALQTHICIFSIYLVNKLSTSVRLNSCQ